MNIAERLQKTFPRHTVYLVEKERFADERYFIFYDRKKKLCLQLQGDTYIVYTLNRDTIFLFPDFTEAEEAIDFMRWLYEYTKWLRTGK